MEHLNPRSFLYVAEFVDANGKKSYKSHNHYSCFGSFQSVTTVTTGRSLTGRFAFSTNYGSKTARRLLKAMRDQKFEFNFNGVKIKMPKVAFHRAHTKGSGYFPADRSGIDKMNYYTVTFPKSTPVAYVYPICKILFKVVGSTQNGTKGTRFMDHLLDAGASFMEATSVIGLMNASGGYRYPLGNNTWGGMYEKSEVQDLVAGRINWGSEADWFKSHPRYHCSVAKAKQGVPTGSPGLPRMTKGIAVATPIDFDMGAVELYCKDVARRTPEKDKDVALEVLTLLREKTKD